MMNCDFLTSVLRSFSENFPTVAAFASEESSADGSVKWAEINIGDVNLYFNDSDFAAWKKKWVERAEENGVKMIFVSRIPNEKLIERLFEAENILTA